MAMTVWHQTGPRGLSRDGKTAPIVCSAAASAMWLAGVRCHGLESHAQRSLLQVPSSSWHVTRDTRQGAATLGSLRALGTLLGWQGADVLGVPRPPFSVSPPPHHQRATKCLHPVPSGRIISPKWKTFKGLKLLQRDKIRLNNAIWRAWHLQYVERRKNLACNFVTPLEAGDGEEHCKPEAGVMEGKNWKRHIQAVTREYHKWRIYSCTQVQKMKDELAASPCQGVPNAQQGPVPSGEAEGSCPMELDPLHDLEMLLADLADTIFYSRHRTHQDNADMIQPTLGQLHPNFGEDFMDTLDPLSSVNRPMPMLGRGDYSSQGVLLHQWCGGAWISSLPAAPRQRRW
nr:PREDICTED: MLX-interacting protein-like [Struthio camelus australis]